MDAPKARHRLFACRKCRRSFSPSSLDFEKPGKPRECKAFCHRCILPGRQKYGLSTAPQIALEPESRDENGRAFGAEGALGAEAGAVLCKWVVRCQVGEGAYFRRWPCRGGHCTPYRRRGPLSYRPSGATEQQGLESELPLCLPPREHPCWHLESHWLTV